MTTEEFIKKMRKLALFYTDGKTDLDAVYEGFETIVTEMERLEDIEDDRDAMQANIDYLKEEIKKLKEGRKSDE